MQVRVLPGSLPSKLTTASPLHAGLPTLVSLAPKARTIPPDQTANCPGRATQSRPRCGTRRTGTNPQSPLGERCLMHWATRASRQTVLQLLAAQAPVRRNNVGQTRASRRDKGVAKCARGLAQGASPQGLRPNANVSGALTPHKALDRSRWQCRTSECLSQRLSSPKRSDGCAIGSHPRACQARKPASTQTRQPRKARTGNHHCAQLAVTATTGPVA